MFRRLFCSHSSTTYLCSFEYRGKQFGVHRCSRCGSFVVRSISGDTLSSIESVSFDEIGLTLSVKSGSLSGRYTYLAFKDLLFSGKIMLSRLLIHTLFSSIEREFQYYKGLHESSLERINTLSSEKEVLEKELLSNRASCDCTTQESISLEICPESIIPICNKLSDEDAEFEKVLSSYALHFTQLAYEGELLISKFTGRTLLRVMINHYGYNRLRRMYEWGDRDNMFFIKRK